MIVDSQFTYDLTVGQDRRIPADNDAQTFIPAQVSPVVLALQPTVFDSTGGNPTYKNSVIINKSFAQNNAGAFSSDLITLAPGLWELEMTMATQFDFVGTVATLNGAAIRLIDTLATTVNVLKRIAAIGTFTDYNRIRVLLRSATKINAFVGITTVAQHADADICVNAIRII